MTSPASYTVTRDNPPTITSFTPSSGITGSQVTINGTFFSGASSVKFGTLPAAFTIETADQIKAIVPNGAGSASSTTSYTPTFSVTSVSPASGPSGTEVAITGVGFTSTSTVKFNGTAATITRCVLPTELVVTVPAGATTGRITVTNTTSPVGTVTSRTSYTTT